MKFRTCEPCPNCGCRCEEYNPITGYIGCPSCETKREESLSWHVAFLELVYEVMRRVEDCHINKTFEDLDLIYETINKINQRMRKVQP